MVVGLAFNKAQWPGIILKSPFINLVYLLLTLSMAFSLKLADENITFGYFVALSYFGISAIIFLMFVFFYPNTGVSKTRPLAPERFGIFLIMMYFFSMFAIQFIFHNAGDLLTLFAYAFNAFVLLFIMPRLFIMLDLSLQRFLSFYLLFCGLIFFTQIWSLFFDSFFGLPTYSKDHYARFAGFPAVSGIFEHPSHASIVFSLGLISALYLIQKRAIRFGTLFFCLCLAGLFLSQGRVGLLGSVLVASYFLVFEARLRSSPLKLGTFAFFIFICLFCIIIFSETIEAYLRISQGSSGRVGAWLFALEFGVLQPWVGFGFGSPAEITAANEVYLRQLYGSQISGVGFHNSFINDFIQFGFLPPLMLLSIFLVSWVSCRNKAADVRIFLQSCILVCFVAVFFVGMSLGGVRIQSVFFTLLVGLCISPFGRHAPSTTEGS